MAPPLIGPLTTTFRPAGICTALVAHLHSTGVMYALPGKENIDCFPSLVSNRDDFFTSPADAYFSPGVCPDRYTPYSASGSRAATVHSYNCCPSSLTFDTRPNASGRDRRGCIGSIISPTASFTYGKPSEGPVSTTASVVEVIAYALQIEFRNVDTSALGFGADETARYSLSAGTTSRESAAISTATTPSTTTSTTPTPSPKSSRRLQVELGVGLGLGLGLILLCSALYFVFRYRQKHLSNDETAYPAVNPQVHGTEKVEIKQHLSPQYLGANHLVTAEIHSTEILPELEAVSPPLNQ